MDRQENVVICHISYPRQLKPVERACWARRSARCRSTHGVAATCGEGLV
jgi:hypothetical protein